MPRIRIEDIPNAPRVLAGTALLRVPGLQSEVGGVAAALQAEELEAGAFGAVEAGLWDEAAGQMSGVFAELSRRLAESKNHGDVARAEALMLEAREAFAQEKGRKPEGEWVSLWEKKYRPQVEKGLSKLGLSGWARERVEPGFGVGQAYGSANYWYRQGSGALYHELRKEGVPHQAAQQVSAGFGVPYAAIELSQLTKLVPGMKQTVGRTVAGAVKRRLAALAKEKGVEYAEQIGQETGQELLQIASEALAEWISGVRPPEDKRPAWNRIWIRSRRRRRVCRS